VLELRVQMTVSLDSTVVSLMGVTVIVVEEEPMGMVVDVPMEVKSDPDVAVLAVAMVKNTVSELFVAPVRVTVKTPASGPVSEAFGSVALMVTVGNVGESLSVMLTVALLDEPTM
jgi:hypothetical protein